MDPSGHEEEIPIPIASTYGGRGHSHGGNHTTIIHESPPSLHPSSNGPPPPPLSTATTGEHHNHNIVPYNPKKGAVVRYKECLKNHAASIGGNVTDGCGEFMPSGGEGTLEALKCSACSCHRNFHRKEVEGESSTCDYYHYLKGRGATQKGLLISGPEAYGYPTPAPTHQRMVMPLGALQASESDMEGGGGMVRSPVVKKRFRTKFTPEQKEKMLGFAEKVGWRLQRQEESVVQQFCQEVGVKRRVLKVWMHNNKHNLAKKNHPPLQLE